MILGIFLSPGDSFKNMSKSGQDDRFKRFYILKYSKNFSEVFVFSYANESIDGLPSNVRVIPNKFNLHRYVYAILMPFINLPYILKCDVFRVYHLFGTPPAIVSKIFFGKPYAFNYAYDYGKFAAIEGKYIQLILSKLLKSFAVFFATKIFAATRKIYRELPVHKTLYLPNGVDTFFFKSHKNKKKNKIPIILSVGRLEKQKNLKSLVLAIKSINATLFIVGWGSLANELLETARKNDVNLKLTKKVKNTEMPRIYNSADIFVLPSLAEGSPKVLLEAMSCGLPGIASNIPEIKEIIDNNVDGFLVDSRPDAIRAKILEVYKNKKLLEKISKNAQKKILREFDLEKLLSKEIDVLKKTA